MDYDLIVVKTLERVYKNYYYIIRGYIMNNELLPIGSVVLIGNSKKKVMIVGVCQKGGQDPNAIWDYTALSFRRDI